MLTRKTYTQTHTPMLFLCVLEVQRFFFGNSVRLPQTHPHHPLETFQYRVFQTIWNTLLEISKPPKKKISNVRRLIPHLKSDHDHREKIIARERECLTIGQILSRANFSPLPSSSTKFAKLFASVLVNDRERAPTQNRTTETSSRKTKKAMMIVSRGEENWRKKLQMAACSASSHKE